MTPTDRRLPDRLARLERAAASWGCFFAGNVELEPAAPDGALAWFADKAEPAAQFLTFGHEGTGGLYALWLYEGRTAEDAPVVLLGSEGQAKVLAGNADEFLALLTLDLRDLGCWDDLSEQEPAETPGHAKLVEWLAREGISRPADPEAKVAAARRAHPDLEAFVERAMSGD